MNRTLIAIACLVVFGLSSTSRATDPITHIADMVGAASQTADEGAPAGGLYSAGTFDVNVMGGAYTGINNVDTIYFGGVGVDWFFWDDIAIVTEFIGYGVNHEDRLGSTDESSAGFGFNLLARWHCIKSPDEKLAFFLEGGAGIALFNQDTPEPDGSNFNFSPQAGVGVKWRCADNIGIIAGVRYLHISNAGLASGDNPGIDAIGGYGGLTIDF